MSETANDLETQSDNKNTRVQYKKQYEFKTGHQFRTNLGKGTVKQTRNRPGVAQRVLGGLGSQIS